MAWALLGAILVWDRFFLLKIKVRAYATIIVFGLILLATIGVTIVGATQHKFSLCCPSDLPRFWRPDSMSIVVLGLNHKSAPLEIRERLAFDAQEVATALEQLHAMDPQGEFVLLSTCNRVELYYAGEQKADEIAGPADRVSLPVPPDRAGGVQVGSVSP